MNTVFTHNWAEWGKCKPNFGKQEVASLMERVVFCRCYLSELPVEGLKLGEFSGDGPAAVLGVLSLQQADGHGVEGHLFTILLRGLQSAHTDESCTSRHQ